MSLAATTLSGAVTAWANTIQVASATGFAAGSYIRVGDEYMKIQVVNGTAIGVFRGVYGSQAVAHASGEAVVVGTAAEFAASDAGGLTGLAVKPRKVTYTAAGAIAIIPGWASLLAGSAAAMTLADPSLADEGIEIQIIAADAQAYTVTNTSGFNTSSTAGDVATFGGAIGDCMTIKAVGGKWVATNLTDVTLG